MWLMIMMTDSRRDQSVDSPWQWRLQGRANPGIARVFLHTIYHVICLNLLHCVRVCTYTVYVDVTWHVAMDYGGVESTSRASRHEASTVICVCPGYY